MKRLLYTFSLLLASFCSAEAQRQADLQTTLLSPLNGMHVASGQQFNIRVSIKNAGPAALEQLDTVALYLLHDNDTIPVLNGGVLSAYDTRTSLLLKPGDSLIMSRVGSFNTGTVDDTVNLCVIAVPVSGNPSASLADMSMGNNKACAIVYAAGRPNSTGSIAVAAGVKVAPNPAGNQAQLFFDLRQPAEISCTLTDITGRRVLYVPPASYGAGSRHLALPLQQLTPGLFTYVLQCGNERYTGKLLVR